MICTVCSGIPGATGTGGDWSSGASSSLASLVSRTCFCGVPTEQLQSLVESFEMKLEGFLMANFPGKKIKEIREELKILPRTSTKRVHTVKRLMYQDRITTLLEKRREYIKKSEELQPKEPTGRASIEKPLPAETGSSLSDFAKESG